MLYHDEPRMVLKSSFCVKDKVVQNIAQDIDNTIYLN